MAQPKMLRPKQNPLKTLDKEQPYLERSLFKKAVPDIQAMLWKTAMKTKDSVHSIYIVYIVSHL